jgi:hypothetical protein
MTFASLRHLWPPPLTTYSDLGPKKFTCATGLVSPDGVGTQKSTGPGGMAQVCLVQYLGFSSYNHAQRGSRTSIKRNKQP